MTSSFDDSYEAYWDSWFLYIWGYKLQLAPLLKHMPD